MLAEQNGAPAVAEPGPAEVPKTCAWPVWWPERCAQNPIPSRTRPLNTPAPMVLCLKTRESRSPPDPPNTGQNTHSLDTTADHPGAGWSSPVARQAHNLKVTGSNPVPATKLYNTRPACRRHAGRSRFNDTQPAGRKTSGLFAFGASRQIDRSTSLRGGRDARMRPFVVTPTERLRSLTAVRLIA